MRRQRVERTLMMRVVLAMLMRMVLERPLGLALSLCRVRRAMRPLMREGRAGLGHAHEHNPNGKGSYRGSFQVHRHILLLFTRLSEQFQESGNRFSVRNCVNQKIERFHVSI